jgi:hypothetical protein
MDIFLPELIGTMLLIIFGDGVVANVVLSKTKGQNSGWIVIATGWGMAVVVGVYAVAGYTGAHIKSVAAQRSFTSLVSLPVPSSAASSSGWPIMSILLRPKTQA